MGYSDDFVYTISYAQFIPVEGDPEGISFPDSESIQLAIAAFLACVLPVRGLMSYWQILGVCSLSCMLVSSTICLVDCIILMKDVLLMMAVMIVFWSSFMSGVCVIICSSNDILLITSRMSLVNGLTGFSVILGRSLSCCWLAMFDRVSNMLVSFALRFASISCLLLAIIVKFSFSRLVFFSVRSVFSSSLVLDLCLTVFVRCCDGVDVVNGC